MTKTTGKRCDLGTRLVVAPMMDWTDRHDRYFLRQFSANALLFTEMVTAKAVLFGDQDKLLGFSPAEHPVALQLGGAEPEDMAAAAKAGERFGYDEVNINVGCPSDRVQAGRFGACLMKEPATVAACVSEMRSATSLPVTVKCRLGVDEHDSYDHLAAFVETVSAAGCERFYLHARKAWLKGLSPKQNREIPPLKYDVARRVKADYPALEIVLNGGLASVEDCLAQLPVFDGVMLGRAAYRNPYLLAQLDAALFGHDRPCAREDAVSNMLPYIAEQTGSGVRLNAITRHMLGVFQGLPGAKAWRRYLSEHAHLPGAGAEVVETALAHVTRAAVRTAA